MNKQELLDLIKKNGFIIYNNVLTTEKEKRKSAREELEKEINERSDFENVELTEEMIDKHIKEWSQWEWDQIEGTLHEYYCELFELDGY